ncbi:hypothetical protein [Jeotgalibacillus campisalis]|uniref:Uncharacterized protein n=1 Tax=Jeotgalibacillus campisalis TaxID=220754 RepID=A0A0C2SGM4_9BACL|nr:hypothetical protein [Jeotgalibacillus campisalis]KIL53074.1 hypothetical protein KR50_04030 [Jeotgalibacillus campisalis]
MVNFQSFQGMITMVSEFYTGQNEEEEGCYTLLEVVDNTGTTVNFIVLPTTYFLNQAVVSTGDFVTGFYDANAPVPLIYPPRYRALIVVKHTSYQKVKADYFDNQLVSRDGQLKLNLSPFTPIQLANGQPFLRSPANRNLLVVYNFSTKSIPAQTTPEKIIVWCS